MKIVHIITSLGIGGAEKLLVNVANMQALNNDVTIIYFKVDTLVTHFKSGITVIHIPLNKKIVSEIKTVLKQIQPNIIHTHLTHADLFGLLAVKSLKNIKSFTTIHNTRFKFNSIDYLYYMLYACLFNFLSRKTTIIAISRSVEKLIIRNFRVSKDRIRLLYNTIPESENELLDLPENLELHQDKFKILFVGRLTRQKAVHVLLEAVSRLNIKIRKKTVVYIVGEGELRDELTSLTKKLGLYKMVFFEGLSNNVKEYFENCDLFVLPSVFEGFGIVILEAFKYKIPIIASNVDGPSELITHGENGFLCEKNNINAFTEKIEALYLNQDLALKFINNGEFFFKKNFTPASYVQKLNKIYQS